VSSARVLATRVRGSAWSPIATIGHVTVRETAMAEKSKGGREVRKPKAEKNKKVKGQTPPAGSVQATTTPKGAKPGGS
jgi:hypothetical protein